MHDTLDRTGELLQLQNYFKRQAQKEAAAAAVSSMEKMMITALQGNAPSELIESMRKNAGITEARLDELKKSDIFEAERGLDSLNRMELTTMETTPIL